MSERRSRFIAAAPGLPELPPPVRDGIVLGAAVGIFGAGFGVLAVTTGLSIAQAMAMSMLVFTGGSQFAAVGVIDSGGTVAAALGSALLLAARNGIYGLTVSRLLPGPWWKRAVAAHLTIDESTALATGQDGDQQRATAFWAAGLSVFVFWNVGTFLGALSGSGLGDPASLGLDAAFPAGFIALVMPALRKRPGRAAATVGGLIALVCVPLTPAGVPILAAAIAAPVVLGFQGLPRAPQGPPEGERKQ
ncbi:MAG: branched-chain amino acid ABC transporter permease [Actinomycetia bacterium]|nr:branched-chain amino acid ABC transporter permease [Actinomycetes bacterium]